MSLIRINVILSINIVVILSVFNIPLVRYHNIVQYLIYIFNLDSVCADRYCLSVSNNPENNTNAVFIGDVITYLCPAGKSASIWDTLTHNNPEYVSDGSNGDIACDSYAHAIDDIELIKDLGLDFYRFSLSWTRILPTGFIHDINADGIRYYNEVLDELEAQNISAMVTLYHWDLPQTLQEMGGWINEAMVQFFEDYARVAFENFGDRVKYWTTFNEPMQVCGDGYGLERMAPLLNVTGIADYVCTHTLLKAHAAAYHLYDKEFRPTQGGMRL